MVQIEEVITKEILRLLMLLAIGTGVLGCEKLWPESQEVTDGQELTELTAEFSRAMARVEDTLYLATEKDGVFRLNNRSQSWERPLEGFYTVKPALATDNTTLYVSDGGAIYRVEPDGKTVTRITPQGIEWVPAIVWAVEGDTIYATRQTRLIRSKDGGNEWHEIQPNGDDVSIHSLAVKGTKIFLLTEHREIVYSTDDGENWSVVTKGFPDTKLPIPTRAPLHFYRNSLYIGTIEGLYRLIEGTSTIRFAGLDGRYTTSIVTSQNALYIGTWPTGVFRSTNGGETWQNIGLKGIGVTTLAMVGNRLYVGSFNTGVFYTEDEGNTWHPLNKGLTRIIY